MAKGMTRRRFIPAVAAGVTTLAGGLTFARWAFAQKKKKKEKKGPLEEAIQASVRDGYLVVRDGNRYAGFHRQNGYTSVLVYDERPAKGEGLPEGEPTEEPNPEAVKWDILDRLIAGEDYEEAFSLLGPGKEKWRRIHDTHVSGISGATYILQWSSGDPMAGDSMHYTNNSALHQIEFRALQKGKDNSGMEKVGEYQETVEDGKGTRISPLTKAQFREKGKDMEAHYETIAGMLRNAASNQITSSPLDQK